MGGQKIDDHSFWAGGKSSGSVFPEGAKVKHMEEGEGAGKLDRYEDSPEAIKSFQNEQRSQAKGHPQKAGYRN